MAEFLVELYVAHSNRAAADGCAARARDATEAVGRVRYLGSLFAPEDETCFLLFEADSEDAVLAVAQRARLVFERVAEVHASGLVKD